MIELRTLKRRLESLTDKLTKITDILVLSSTAPMVDSDDGMSASDKAREREARIVKLAGAEMDSLANACGQYLKMIGPIIWHK